MQDVVRVTKNGTSLAINVTKICNDNGIEAGDYVVIELNKLNLRDLTPVGIEEAREVVRKIFLTEGQKWGLVTPEITWYAEDIYAHVPREETKFVIRQLLEEGAIYVAEMDQYRMDPEHEFWGGLAEPHNNRQFYENRKGSNSPRSRKDLVYH